MADIVTVLRSGGEYGPQHVDRLMGQCPGHRFVCLSDVDVPCERVPLLHDWPGWWSKMEIFRLPGPCLYLDLDTTVRGLSRVLALAEDFVTLRDFNFPHRNVQSSVMAWRGDMRWLYEAFRADPDKHMRENNTGRWWGDQGFIERNASPAYWQDVLPGALVSWKKHCRGGVPDDADVVVFHGKPRPWEVEL